MSLKVNFQRPKVETPCPQSLRRGVARLAPSVFCPYFLFFSVWRRPFDAGATFLGVKFVEEPRELLQHGIPATLDGAQRMVGGHALVEVNDGQEVRLGLRFSTRVSLTHRFHFCSNHERFFEQPVSICHGCAGSRA
jgi:hypothetical protein